MAGSIQHRRDRPSPWRARYVGADGREHSKSFRIKVDAERWLRSELSALDRGLWVDPTAGTIRYGEWCATWLASLTGLKPKTRATYEEVTRNVVLPTFRDLEIRHITPPLVRDWIARLSSRGTSASRMRQARTLLKASLDVAVDDGRLGRNPVVNVKVPVSRPREQRFLTAKELTTLAASAEAIQAQSGLLVEVLGWGGIRWGEAVALRQSAVNILERRLIIRESATEVEGILVFGSPKSHRTREVVVPRRLADSLGATFTAGESNRLVFTTPTGEPLRGSNWRTRVFKPALEASGLDPELRPHDLRHTAASLAISGGASVKVVQRQLGHSSPAVTLNTYTGLFNDDLESLADYLDQARDAAISERDSAQSRPTRIDAL